MQVNRTRGLIFGFSRALEHDLQVLIEQKAADVSENRARIIFSIFLFVFNIKF